MSDRCRCCDHPLSDWFTWDGFGRYCLLCWIETDFRWVIGEFGTGDLWGGDR